MKEMQEAVNQFAKEKGLNATVAIRIIDLASEVGELSKEVLKSTDYGNKTFITTESFKEELGDVLFSLVCVANEAKVDLQACLQGVLDKYNKRFEGKGSIASK